MAPAFVRATPLSGSTSAAGSGGALTVTLPTAAAAGNALIVQIGLNASSNASVSALTDNAGNTYTQRVDGFQTGINTRITTWDCLNLATNATTLTITTTAAVGIRLYADEWSGLAGYGYDAGSAVGAASTTTPTAPTVTASVGEVLSTGINYGSATFTATQSNTAATTRGPVTASNGRVYITDGTATTAGAYSTPWTLSSAAATGQSIVGYTSATARADTVAFTGTGTLGAAGSGTAVTGSAPLNGTGSLNGTGQNPNPVVAAALNGTGTLTASPQGDITNTVALTGAGTLGAVGAIVGRGTATLAGTGTLTATGAIVGLGTAALTGIGFLNAATRPATTDTAALNGTGTLGTTTSPALHGTAAFGGGGTLNAAGAATHRGTASFTSDGTFTVTLTLPQLRDLATLNGEGTLEALGVKREPRRPRDITITAVTEPETAWLTTEPGAAWETTDPTTATATDQPTVAWLTTEPAPRPWPTTEPAAQWLTTEPAVAATTTEPAL